MHDNTRYLSKYFVSRITGSRRSEKAPWLLSLVGTTIFMKRFKVSSQCAFFSNFIILSFLLSTWQCTDCMRQGVNKRWRLFYISQAICWVDGNLSTGAGCWDNKTGASIRIVGVSLNNNRGFTKDSRLLPADWLTNSNLKCSNF